MKLQQLHEARYHEPFNTFVYLECGEEYGDTGYDADWCWGYVGHTKAQVGEYEIAEYENPTQGEDAFVHVFNTHNEAIQWATDRVELTQDIQDDIIEVMGSYLETQTPE